MKTLSRYGLIFMTAVIVLCSSEASAAWGFFWATPPQQVHAPAKEASLLRTTCYVSLAGLALSPLAWGVSFVKGSPEGLTISRNAGLLCLGGAVVSGTLMGTKFAVDYACDSAAGGVKKAASLTADTLGTAIHEGACSTGLAFKNLAVNLGTKAKNNPGTTGAVIAGGAAAATLVYFTCRPKHDSAVAEKIIKPMVEAYRSRF